MQSRRQFIIAFDPNGNPVSHKLRTVEGVGEQWFAVVWNSIGDSLGAFGPGADPQFFGQRTSGTYSQGLVPTSDTSAWAKSLSERGAVWLEEWQGNTSRPVLRRLDVWRKLDPDGGIAPQDSGLAEAITADSEDRIWGLSTYDLKLDYPSDPQYGTLEYHGILWVVDPAGRFIGARFVDGYPGGFADPEHFYTVRRDSSGVFVISIHQQRLDCTG
jgi:hypothetical protein